MNRQRERSLFALPFFVRSELPGDTRCAIVGASAC